VRVDVQAALCALAGLQTEDVLFAQWNSETFRPCHMLTHDKAKGALVLTVRTSSCHAAQPVRAPSGMYPCVIVSPSSIRVG
jgi:hypothetical protein